MGEPKKRKATYADIERLPDNMVGEILEGDLVVSPRPAARHGLTATGLTTIVQGAFQFGSGGPGGWWIIAEPELHLGEDVVVPDIAAWRRNRMPAVPNTAAIELPPDWVCEVLSISTTRYDRGPKKRIYRRAGVEHAWIVDRGNKLIEVYKAEGNEWSDPEVYAGNEKVRIPPFDAIEIDLSLLWAE